MMVFEAITSDGKMPPIFLEKVRVDSKTYFKGVLEKEELPWAKSFSLIGHGLISRAQLQHTRLVRNALPRPHLVGRLAPKQSSPKSIGPFRSVLKTKACSTKHRSLDAPRATLVEAWEDSDEGYLRAAVDASPRRISACTRAKGCHFEI
ncbi:unnamed protein product [Haemonchus placei]|uniref:Uncharacterized protein n=1 Tax=Haemonchus placei TaxID=6290 RepID=A0A3P7WNQ3_HAEPC|nr:unnamed protein product [Haemonchus placei]